MTAQQLWAAYLSTQEADEQKALQQITYEAWAFGDDPDTLAALVCRGVKTATASAYALYEIDGENLPQPNEYSVILDSREHAVCIIRTTRVFVIPFDRVDECQAWREGEGDRSLAYWRKVHRDFFTQELAEAGLAFAEDMPVVCEEFTCVFPAPLTEGT